MHACKKFQDLFYEYIDGTISKADKVELLKHLESCEQCKEELMFVENILQELHETPAVPLPDNFNAALRKKLEHTPAPSERNWLRYFPKCSLAVSAVAAFAIMVIAYNGHFKPSEWQSSDIPAELPATSVPQASEQELKSETANNLSGTATTNEAAKEALSDETIAGQPATQAPKKADTAAQSTSRPKQTKPSSSVASSILERQENEVASPSFDNNSSNHKASGGGGSGGSSGGGSSASISVARTEETAVPARNPQGLIFVIHSTVSQQTLKQLYELPTFETVDTNYYQIQRSYQHALIELLKDCEYSIHFASEASRVDQNAIIIELI